MILLVAAMAEEIKDIKKHVHQNVDILLTGIGKVNAAMALTEYLANHQVESIINMGFCGATQPFEVGDLVLAKDAKYHDFDLSIFGYQHGQVPGYPEAFTSDEKLMKFAFDQLPDLKEGLLYTGDYFKTEHQETSCLFDMEGAAIYQVAHHYQIPCLSIKVVSDVMGMENHFLSYKKFESEMGSKLLDQAFSILFSEVKS